MFIVQLAAREKQVQGFEIQLLTWPHAAKEAGKCSHSSKLDTLIARHSTVTSKERISLSVCLAVAMKTCVWRSVE